MTNRLKNIVIICSLLLLPAMLFAKKQGRELIDSLARELPKTRQDTNQAKLLNSISFTYYSYAPDSGLLFGQKALSLAEKLNWKPGIAKAYNALGANYIALNDIGKAKTATLKALAVNEAIGNKKDAANNLGNMGILFTIENNYPEALTYLFRTLKIFEELDDKAGIATQYGTIGTLYEEQNMLDKALGYDTMALRLYRELDNRNAVAVLLGNIGNIYSELHNPNMALHFEQEALQMFEAMNNDDGIARNLSNIGLIYAAQKKYEAALSNYFRALAISEKLGDLYMMGTGNGNIATLYFALVQDTVSKIPTSAKIPAGTNARLALAVGYAKKAVPYLEQSNSIKALAEAYKLLSDAQFMAKDYKSAVENYRRYTAFSDSVFSIEKNKKIHNLEQQREIDLRESKIKILTQESKLKGLSADKEKLKNKLLIGGIALVMITGLSGVMYFVRKQRSEKLIANEKINTLLKDQELQSVSNMLEVQEEERKRIAADLHDRLGSMLSTVKLHFNTVEQQIDTLREQNKDQYQKATTLLDEACDEVRKIAHNLVSGELVKFGLVSALNQLKDTIEETGKLSIKVFAFGMEERLASNTEISLYRIVQELLNNILKHAKASEMTIQLNKVENNLNIVVEDNGAGYDVNAALAKDGMGLRNMQTRVKKLNGTIEFDSMKGRGSTTIIDLPV